MTNATNNTPSIYVACLSSYNSGILHGVWIDLDQYCGVLPRCGEDVMHEVRGMLEESPVPDAEEWAVHDHQGFGGVHIGENPDFDNLCEIAQLVEAHGGAILSMIDNDSSLAEDPQELLRAFEASYVGQFESWEDYAYHCVEEQCILDGASDLLAMYFDYKAYGYTLSIENWMDDDGNVFAPY